jgi:hypothetical protein
MNNIVAAGLFAIVLATDSESKAFPSDTDMAGFEIAFCYFGSSVSFDSLHVTGRSQENGITHNLATVVVKGRPCPFNLCEAKRYDLDVDIQYKRDHDGKQMVRVPIVQSAVPEHVDAGCYLRWWSPS